MVKSDEYEQVREHLECVLEDAVIDYINNNLPERFHDINIHELIKNPDYIDWENDCYQALEDVAIYINSKEN